MCKANVGYEFGKFVATRSRNNDIAQESVVVLFIIETTHQDKASEETTTKISKIKVNIKKVLNGNNIISIKLDVI